MKSPSDVEDEKYDEFYQFIAKAFDKPLAKVCYEKVLIRRIGNCLCAVNYSTYLALVCVNCLVGGSLTYHAVR